MTDPRGSRGDLQVFLVLIWQIQGFFDVSFRTDLVGEGFPQEGIPVVVDGAKGFVRAAVHQRAVRAALVEDDPGQFLFCHSRR